ncbi:MAG: penicillin-binding protein 2 [Actinomycetota bacterium]|nr:penicillin-binding protein 2 [Actinomycetota bacterium]
MDTDSNQVRLSAIGIVAISLFLALFMRLWFLQGIDRQEFEATSVSNRLRYIHDEAPRGRILDRNGKVLVDNRTSIVVSLDREPLRKLEPEERTVIFEHLAETLGSFGLPTKVSTIAKRYDDKRWAPQAYVPIAEDVPKDVEIYLMERSDQFPGVIVERQAIRVYPYGNVAVHLLGYVGEINDKELEARGVSTSGSTTTTEAPSTTDASDDEDDPAVAKKEYQLGDSIGKGGVEAAYEEHLRGIPGKRTIEVNAKGDLVDVVSLDPPVAGDDVWLSVDVDLQAHAERLLEAKIQQVRNGPPQSDNKGSYRTNAPQGSVVVQDPNNGQILAMASYPDYDPSSIVNGISSDLWATFQDPNSGQPLVNWAIQGAYAPGSTFKLFTAWAGQRTGLLAGDDVISDPGFYKAENCEGETCDFQNAGRKGHPGPVGLARSLTVSSDVYYYRMADKFWNRRGEFGETPIQDAAAEFGLGARTGIPLGGENAGRLPTPAKRKEAFEARPDLFLTGDWRTGDNINMSIGQGDVAATPLQLADAYSTFANGGTRYQPQVATKITRALDATLPPGQEGNYELVDEIEPVVQGRLQIDPGHYSQIWEGLVGVTAPGTGGTASAAFAATPTAWPMAGKTGTAQVSKKADTALFVGWGPAVADPNIPPQYTVSVVIPESGFGSTIAAPLAFRVLQPVSTGALPPACTVADTAACDLAADQALQDSRNDTTTGTSG